jgi:hypothetical protein
MREDSYVELSPYHTIEFDSKSREGVTLIIGSGLRQTLAVPDLAVLWAYLDVYLTKEDKIRGEMECPTQAYFVTWRGHP